MNAVARAGYQITQQREPLLLGGSLMLASGRAVRVERAHLEQDSAQTLRHDSCASAVAARGRSIRHLPCLLTAGRAVNHSALPSTAHQFKPCWLCSAGDCHCPGHALGRGAPAALCRPCCSGPLLHLQLSAAGRRLLSLSLLCERCFYFMASATAAARRAGCVWTPT